MNYQERTAEIFHRAEQNKKKKTAKNRIIASVTSVGVCAALLLSVLFVPYPSVYTDLSRYEDSEYYTLIQALSPLTTTAQKYRNNWEKWTAGITSFFSLGYDRADPAVGTASSAEGGSYVETTDNQVEGIVEGDLFKRSEDYIFYLTAGYLSSEEYSGYAYTLNVYSVAGEDSEKVSEFTFYLGHGYVLYNEYLDEAEMYLSEDCRTVTVLTQAYDKDTGRVYTAVIPLDVSSVTEISVGTPSFVSGSYVSSRSVDGEVLVVSNFTVYKDIDYSDETEFVPYSGKAGSMTAFDMADILLPETATVARYTLICRYEDGEFTSRIALLSYAQEVYVSAENIYVARGYRETDEEGWSRQMSEIARVSYADGLQYEGSMTVEGSILNQYSMDEQDGVLRVVTTPYAYPTTADDIAEDEFAGDLGGNASLFCLDVETGEVVGSLERFAPDGETVQSVRFDGDKAYVCTAVEYTDPVFVLDLSDYADITAKQTPEITGYSVALRQFQYGTLLGMGYGDSLTGFKAEVYAETADGVESLACYTVSNCTFSEEYKSYFIDADNGLAGLALVTYDDAEGEYELTYLLLRFDGENLVCEARILLKTVSSVTSTDVSVVRACLIDGALYILFDDGISVYTI